MVAADMPAAEVEVTVELVRSLLRTQFPHLAARRVEHLDSGWDNVLYLMGHDLVARLPRRAVAVPLLQIEQRWLPDLAPSLPLPVPVPVGIGTPGDGYPWPWSICRFVPGRSLLSFLDQGGSLDDASADGSRLGAFHASLHRPAPTDAPHNPFRGIPLADRHDRLLAHLEVLDGTHADAALSVWDDARRAPPWTAEPRWIHGDPHPGNLVTDGHRITGVVDFGDMTGGDPATDLAVAWTVFDAGARPAYREAVAADDATWRRARGWALCMAVALLASSADNPPYERLGTRTLAAVLDDPG